MTTNHDREPTAQSNSSEAHAEVVPDTATTYERAKPAKQSPGGKLGQAPAEEGKRPDQLQHDEAPDAPPKSEAK